MKRKILKNMLLLTFVTVILTSVFICGVLYNHQINIMRQEIKNQAAYIAEFMNADSFTSVLYLDKQGLTNRITHIAQDGTVLYDNHRNAAVMENHLDRPEVESALSIGFGETTRLSDTLGQQTYYYAIRLMDGTVLRVSITTDTIYSIFIKVLPYIILIVCGVSGFVMIIAVNQAQQVIAPINSIKLDNPMNNNIYDELSPLLIRIHHLKQHINRQMKEAREKQEQFTAITHNMAEGLIILNNKGMVLSVNRSAVKILGAKDEDYTGKHIIHLSRSFELQKIVETSLKGSPIEDVIVSAGGSFRVWANPVPEIQGTGGVILFFLDVTESEKAETFRREFSANVSHELKTPLTVISGYAELIKNNLVRQEDIPAFSGKIFAEAKRMIKLIDDVIALSRLDENDINLSLEDMDLLEAAKNVSGRLSELARQKGISLAVSGEPVIISAVPRLLDELIYNLCDNAIQYNRENGEVNITISNSNGKAILVIEDTGIGIPEEHQGRIFERFYRVDKSHSKETGGTGLGLSIVKHVAAYHNADINLDSTVGTGTKITVSFSVT